MLSINLFTDYPLPPAEEKQEILRVVVRESMSADLVDKLISDIVEVTQTLMEADQSDLSAWQPASTTLEKQHSSRGHDAKHRHHAKHPMSKGVHRSVC